MTSKVTLSGGKSGIVYSVPPFLLADIESLPEFSIDWDEDGDEEVKAKDESMRKRKEDVAYLYAFQDWEVPRGWNFPDAASWAGIQIGDGDEARKLAYIKYGLLLTPDDVHKVRHAMFGATAEGVERAEASFRPIRKIARWLHKTFAGPAAQ